MVSNLSTPSLSPSNDHPSSGKPGLLLYNIFMNQNELYLALSVKTDEDLLRHFPSRYEDLHPTLLPDEPEDGYRAVLKGTVSGLRNFRGRGNSLIRFQFRTTLGKTVSCILYNQPFYLTKLSAGKDLLIVCYYSEPRKAFMVYSILDMDSYFVMTGIKPVYTLPKAVSSSYFTSYIRKLLSYPREASYLVSPLPGKLIEKYRLLNEFDAYKAIHLPISEKNLKDGLRVFKYEEALAYSIRSLSLKKAADSIKKKENSPIDHVKINGFVSSLSYKLTKDQLAAIREIVADMEKDTIMYRLLQGDVGTGKTIVAFAALYANYLRGKQGVLMAPTFELAKQHYENAKRIFASFPIHIAFLAGAATKAKEKREIIEGLANGTIDILISTSAVLSSSLSFSGIGLAIIDEQQRFGVEQRESLIQKGEGCDLLMMSATPIPRTLSQIINADLEVSTLQMFPHGQRKVHTALVTSVDPLIPKAIHKALDAKRQIFVIAPKIEKGNSEYSSAESVYQDFCERYGKDNVQLLHGRIKKEEQDRIIASFVNGEKLILVSTTVVEVGIDVSKACLLLVYDANFFGLSSLHQLRGRIGRSGDFALALFIYDGKEKEATEKLSFLAENKDGLKISEFDLKQRGAGSYSGSSQSGKSELRVCNFVEDYPMFECAKKDAAEILSHPEEAENAAYLKRLDSEYSIHLS